MVSVEYIITFKSTNNAIKAERYLLDKKTEVKVLPLPSQLKAGCGICLRIGKEEIKHALKTLNNDAKIELELYSREVNNNKYIYTEIKDWGAFMGEKTVSLMDNCISGGCGAKISQGELSEILKGLPAYFDENLLVGYDTQDDAAVYKIDGNYSLVTTADFFPPMVNDAKTFGRIAAANALSDIYAMGGKPITALNLVCFPQSMDLGILKEILQGGAEKALEASTVLAGGHSIYDKEPKYGMAVTGLVENSKILRNNTPEKHHKLILTKPLGTGIIMAALRGEVAKSGAIEKAITSMERLNKYAAEKMQAYRVSACTDITGFGLLGHIMEMAIDKVSVLLYPEEIPYFDDAYNLAGEYIITAAGQKNRNHLADKTEVEELPFALQELLFDPQTSGGLLICVDPTQADELLRDIKSKDPAAKIIGEIINRESKTILFKK